jgi:DNA-binding transcriptional LysR family regulator
MKALAAWNDWSDLRFFLEVARSGTLLAAARRLEVEHTTIARRLDRLEQQLGAPLFDRHRSGCTLTESGLALLPHAEAMESAALAAVEDTRGIRVAVSGSVRLGAPEVFGTRIVTPALPALLDAHPELSVELLLLPRFPSLASREADLAVTLSPPSGGRYVTVRLAELNYYLYANPDYLARHPRIRQPADLASHRFVDYVHDQLLSDELRYLDELVGKPQRVFTATGMLAQYEAINAGVGLGMMTPYVPPAGSSVVRVLPEAISVQRTLWLTAPADLLRLRRVRAVWDFLRETAAQHPAFTSG